MDVSHRFEGKRVLITGGLGFIGSALARALVAGGARVTIVDSLIEECGGSYFNINGLADAVCVNISDVRDPFAMRHLLKGQDILFNLAAQTSHVGSMVDPYNDLNTNVTAQLSMLEICRAINPSIKIVFASTRQLYGKAEYLPVDEEHPVHPVDVNGINKFAGEAYHLLYNNVYGIRASVLRLTNTYGPGMRVKDARQTFIGVWIRQLIEGKPIAVFGDGLQLRDFNYVDDVVEAFLLAADRDEANGEVFNLGSAEIINLKDLAARLTALCPGARYEMTPFPPERKAIDIGDYHSDFSKIQGTLGWTPNTSLDGGLRKSLQFYVRHRSHYWDSAE